MNIFKEIFSAIKKTYYGLTKTINPYNSALYELEKADNPSGLDIAQGIENVSSGITKGIDKAIVQPIKKIIPEISGWFKVILYGLILGIILYIFLRKK